VQLEITSTGAFTITGFGAIWPGGTAFAMPSGNGKKAMVLLTSTDGGTTKWGHIVGSDFA
jgi:hypothetical protein